MPKVWYSCRHFDKAPCLIKRFHSILFHSGKTERFGNMKLLPCLKLSCYWSHLMPIPPHPILHSKEGAVKAFLRRSCLQSVQLLNLNDTMYRVKFLDTCI